MKRKPDRRGSGALLAAGLVLSGGAGLIHEIAWVRKASLLLGSSTSGFSLVLAVFFLGLAAGAFYFGTRGAEARGRWSRPGVLEIAGGILAVLTPLGFQLADAALHLLYPLVGRSAVLLALTRAILAAVILLPPTFLFGGVLTLLIRARGDATGGAGASRGAAGMVGLNTIGAAAGAAAAGFLLIPECGVDASILVGGALNVLAGTLMLRLDRRESSRATEPATSAAITGAGAWVFSIGLAGFASLGSEVALARFMALIVPNTVTAGTAILVAVLIGTAAGSFGATFLTRAAFRPSRRAMARLFAALQMMAGLVALATPLLIASVRSPGAPPGGLTPGLLALLLPCAVLTGLAFPLAVGLLAGPRSDAGRAMGIVTAANTAGGVAGALLIGFIILPTFGLPAALRVTSGFGLLAGLVAFSLTVSPALNRRALRLGLAPVSAIALWLGLPALFPRRVPEDLLAPRDRLVMVRDGIAANLAVVRDGGNRLLLADGLWQGERRWNHQVVAACLPLALHPDPRSILVVGLGAGQTAGQFLGPGTRRLTVVDLEPALVPIVHSHFNGAWLSDPRVSFRADDGRSFLRHDRDTYDIISLELGQTFLPGVASFYTRDFYRRARERLRPAGLLVQFVPLQFLEPAEFRSVLQTFSDVFPECVLWYNTTELLLIGSRDAPIAWNRDRWNAVRDAAGAALDFSWWGGTERCLSRGDNILSGFLCAAGGVRRLGGGAPVFRDDPPRLEYRVASRRVTDPKINAQRIRENLDPIDLVVFDRDTGNERELVELREKNLRDLVASGILARAEGKTDENDRLACLRAAVEWNPENAAARQALGRALMERGDQAGALPHLESALALDPSHPDRLRDEALRLENAGRLDDAAHLYRRVTDLDPENAEAWIGRGTVAARESDWNGALECFQNAVRFAPASSVASFNLGNALARLGRFAEARRCYETSLKLVPRRPEVLINLGTTLAEEGQLDAAIRHYRRALKLDPDNRSARANMEQAMNMERAEREGSRSAP